MVCKKLIYHIYNNYLDKVNDQIVINCNDSHYSCLLLIIVWHEYSMLKLIFDKGVNFLKKY